MSAPLMQSHHIESLGWTLIHFCWQAATIAIAYKCVDLGLTRGTRKATSQARYLFALAAMLGMFAAAAGTLLYEELRLQRIAAHSASTNSVASDNNLAAAFFNDAAIPADFTTPTLRSNITSALPRPEAFLPWLDGLWMLGVPALSLRTVGGWLVIQRLRTTAIQQIPPDLAGRFARLSRRIGVHGRVALRLSTRIAGPLAVGMVRSLILLPASALTTLTADQLEAVLAHELAHIRRADYLWNILQTMIETLFFFHPAVWWVGSSLRQQRELCCDDIAIASCADPVTYATALLLLEEHRAHELSLHSATPGIPLALALDGHQSRRTLRTRIARILGEPMEPTATPRNIGPFSIVGVCAALAFFLLPLPQVLASLRPMPQQPAIPVVPAAPVAPVVTMTPPEPIAPIPAIEPTAITPQANVAPLPAPVAPAAPPAPQAVPSLTPRLSIRPLATLNRDYNFAYDFHINEAQIADAKAFAQAMAHTAIQAAASATSQTPATTTHSDYIEQMRAAGYNVDLDKFIELKMHGVTPKFAQDMAQSGLGKPTAEELIALRIHGIDPALIQTLKANGMAPSNYQDVISGRIFNITPEYLAAMKAAGFTDLSTRRLVELKVHNITPEYIAAARQQFPNISLEQIVQLQIFKVTPEYVQDVHKQFPNATIEQIIHLRIFKIDSTFIAAAKAHGFDNFSIDQLVKLRISGLLGDSDSARAERDADRAERDAEREKERASRELERQQLRDQQQKEKDRIEKEKDKSQDKIKDK